VETLSGRRLSPLLRSSSSMPPQARAGVKPVVLWVAACSPLVLRAQRTRGIDDGDRWPVAGLFGDRRGGVLCRIRCGGLGRWLFGATCLAALARVAVAG
jgi:hypothetical protein